ncbi:MAG: hypothetical protein CMF25_03995 [Kangiellaceae bacterium]|nr:hypothetical protein [Kangiellaceae bacterium]|tara:strand:+ start:3090 stop:5345 length:2256 start_codon:yes stop_codon:yes gene_type:complete
MILDTDEIRWETLKKIPYNKTLHHVLHLATYKCMLDTDVAPKNLPPLRTLRYILHRVKERPWLDQAVFYALALKSLNISDRYNYSLIIGFNKFLEVACGLNTRGRGRKLTVPEWFQGYIVSNRIVFTPELINQCLKMFIARSRTDASLYDNGRYFMSVSKCIAEWYVLRKNSLGFISGLVKELLLPLPTDVTLLEEFRAKTKIIEEKARRKRKKAVDQVTPYFREIRAIAKNRRKRFELFYSEVDKHSSNALLSTGRPYDAEFCIESDWIKISLWRLDVLVNTLNERSETPTEERKAFKLKIPKKCHLVVEVRNAESLDKEKWWFLPIFGNHLFTSSAKLDKSASEARSRFIKEHGFPNNPILISYIPPNIPEIKRAGEYFSSLSAASLLLGSVFIPYHYFRLLMQYASLFVELLVVTGARISEIAQIVAEPDYLKKIILPVPTKPNEYVEKYAFLAIPKGLSELEPYFITEHTIREVSQTIKIIKEYHQVIGIQTGFSKTQLNPTNKHYEKRSSELRAYVFQCYGENIAPNDLNLCMRLLLHGAFLQYSSDGSRVENIVLTAHLLRHSFAQYAVHYKKIPVDVVAQFLKQKYLPVTEYYSEPTMHIVAERHEDIIDSFLGELDVRSELARSSEQMEELYYESANKVGTLTEVLGGTCTAHGFCASKFSCIGCSSKIPDPKKKGVILRKLKWIEQEMPVLEEENLLAEMQKMKRLERACNLELEEIEVIQSYEKDLNLFDSERIPTKYVKE